MKPNLEKILKSSNPEKFKQTELKKHEFSALEAIHNLDIFYKAAKLVKKI